MFDRDVDAGGRQSWTKAIKDGMLPAEVASGLYASDEFFNASGSIERFVERLYEEILGRDADACRPAVLDRPRSVRDASGSS